MLAGFLQILLWVCGVCVGVGCVGGAVGGQCVCVCVGGGVCVGVCVGGVCVWGVCVCGCVCVISHVLRVLRAMKRSR